MYSAKYGHRRCAEVLIKAGADVGMTDVAGDNALKYAERNKHPECVSVLKYIESTYV